MDTQKFGDDIVIKGKQDKYQVAFMSSLENFGYGATIPKPQETPVINTDYSGSVWANWGSNNLEPIEIASDIENIGVLDAALKACALIGSSKGVQPFLIYNIDSDGKEELEWIDDAEIQDWLEFNEFYNYIMNSTYDRLGYGWNCGSYVLNVGRNKIARVKRHDVYEARLEKKNILTRQIPNIYLSADWKNSGSVYNTEKHIRLELLQENNELADLTDRVSGNSKKVEFAFSRRRLFNGRHYYPQPTYRSNAAWLKIARSVPAFKIAMLKNQITLNYIVHIHPKYWEDKYGELTWQKYSPAEKKSIIDNFQDNIVEWLVGEDKAGTTVFSSGFTDPVSGKFVKYIEVEVVDNKLKDGHLLVDSSSAMSEILIALMMTPALMGAGNPGGKAYGDTSGGSNIREGFLTKIMLMEADRQDNISPLNVVKKFNGWDKRLEKTQTISGPYGTSTRRGRLIFRHQSNLLTTLDTGKSTKPQNL